jgi:hypothetical protein
MMMACQTRSRSARLQDQGHPSTTDFVAIVKWLPGPGRQLLPVDKGKVGAVQIFDEIIATIDDDAGMTP